MIELTWIPEALRAAGWLYLILAMTALGFALVKPTTGKRKALWTLGVIVLFGALPLRLSFKVKEREADKKELRQIRQNILAKATALFDERCKSAGEKIHKTVEDVEGIFLMKVRPANANHGNQFALDDPYGSDSGGETYIKTFFAEYYQVPANPPPGWNPRLGYSYVEAIDPQDGVRYRYTGRIDEPWRYDDSYSKTYKRFVLDRIVATNPMPRYGVTYDDISTREEREYWIAGSSLKVIDLQTNAVIAERIGYMMDRGQGDKSGFRSPWLFARNHACPAFPAAPGGAVQENQTRNFVTKILKPKLDK